jgi:hypothetical protein
MNDQTRPTQPDRLLTSAPSAVPGPLPAATDAAFAGKTPPKSAAIRAGIVLGTALLLAIGTAVAMGASPAPSTPSGASPAAGRPDRPIVPGWRGFGDGGARGDGRGPLAQHRFGAITITAISGSNVSLSTGDGWTRTITVTSSTKITKGDADATLTDLAVGDAVRFAQVRNSDGSYAITAIDIVEPRAAGVVTAVSSDTITITARDGTVRTIKTTATTTYHLDRADAARSDVTVGSAILATGQTAADGTLTAGSIWIRLPHAAGTISAVNDSSITVTRRDRTTVTVHLGSDTTVRVGGVANATVSDLKAGMVVRLEGTQRADGSIDARSIRAGELGQGRARGWPGLDDRPTPSTAPTPSTGAAG